MQNQIFSSMILLINASPLIFLSKIDLVQHLLSLFDQIVIPRGVYDEVTAHDDKASQWI
jgi:predicted nucleic acid-binding protein